jgi:dTDP-4-dehydrorhamnose reductase
MLLLGGTGQVGEEIRRLARHKGIDIAVPTRSELDIKDGAATASLINGGPWRAVINAAAYTEVDRAESDEAEAFAVNAEAPQRMAAETARHGIPFIHISTDYVFDGRKGAPYVETDATGPVNAYGRSKLAGECGVRETSVRHVILRTSWIYSQFRKNFVRTILRLAAERERLTIVADQRGCPTAAQDIAGACLDIAARCGADPEASPYGIFHYAGGGDATWFEFAKAIIEQSAVSTGKAPQIMPIRTEDYPTPAKRAADTRLDCSKVVHAYGVTLRPWRQALQETLGHLLHIREGIA